MTTTINQQRGAIGIPGEATPREDDPRGRGVSQSQQGAQVGRGPHRREGVQIYTPPLSFGHAGHDREQLGNVRRARSNDRRLSARTGDVKRTWIQTRRSACGARRLANVERHTLVRQLTLGVVRTHIEGELTRIGRDPRDVTGCTIKCQTRR